MIKGQLKHVGILGMHWGQRKAEGGGSSNGKKSGNGKPLSEMNSKELATTLKAVQKARNQQYYEKHIAAENDFIRKFDSMAKKQYAEIDAGPGNVVSKAVKKFFTDDKLDKQYMTGIEKAYNDVHAGIKADKARRTANEFKGEGQLIQKYAKIDAERAAARKKLPLVKQFSQFLKDDREVSQMYIDDLIRNQIKNT